MPRIHDTRMTRGVPTQVESPADYPTHPSLPRIPRVPRVAAAPRGPRFEPTEPNRDRPAPPPARAEVPPAVPDRAPSRASGRRRAARANGPVWWRPPPRRATSDTGPRHRAGGARPAPAADPHADLPVPSAPAPGRGTRDRAAATTPAASVTAATAATDRIPVSSGRRPAAWDALTRATPAPRSGRRSVRRLVRRGGAGAGSTPRAPQERRRRVVQGALWSVAAVLAAPVLAFALGYLIFSVPNPDDAVNNQVATVAFEDGTELTRLVPEAGNRTKVGIDDVPVPVRHAVLAAEDRTFYSNPGFDVSGIVRAMWNQVRGGSGGGSTITQQFVKNALVGDEATLWRKYKEVVLSVKISQERSKDEILADYLNAIYFGRGAYGVQSAAQAYFGKDVAQLSTAEGALLAGLIQSPSRWDPAVNPERSVQRWEFVLDGMVSQNWLSPSERAATQFPATVPRSTAAGGGVPADSRGHIVTAVTRELAALGITEQDLAQGGLRITTTIDPDRQRQATEAAERTLSGQPDDLRSALVAIDPATGAVLAYYGGANGHGVDYARAQRLAGSTFKPFVVLAGLLQTPPVGLGETFDGTARGGIRNASGAECARCDLKEGMTVSNNVMFATLARQVGPDAVADAAHSAGITSPLDDADAGIALGNKEISTLDLASAYATIAAGGTWHQPHLVRSVVRADDTVLYEADSRGEQRFSERVARNVTETMLDVAATDGLALPGGRPVAAKTGTVESSEEGQNNDAWMAGFTPTVSTSVWMGTDMNSPIRTTAGAPVEGGSLPGSTWQRFMTGAHSGVPVDQFAPFRPIGEPPRNRVEPTTGPTPGPDGQVVTGVPAPGGSAPDQAEPTEPTSTAPAAQPEPSAAAPPPESPTNAPEEQPEPEPTAEPGTGDS